MKPCRGALGLASILLLSGPAGAVSGDASGSKPARSPTGSAAPARSPSKTPGKTPVTPVSALPLGESPRRYTGEPISLDLKDADLKDVLLTFGKLTGLNVAIDPEVKGSVTVRLVDVPWDQALELVLRMNGLGYTLEGNVVRVGLPSRL